MEPYLASGPIVRPAVQKPDGVFDVPQQVHNERDAIGKLVAEVSKEWRWGMVDEKSLAIMVPVDQDPLAVSKVRFVALLEYAEEELGLQRVIALFRKPDVSPDRGFARTLRYIGFRAVAPDATPSTIDSDNLFAMSYMI